MQYWIILKSTYIIKEALSVLMLCTPVFYIYIWQLASFRAAHAVVYRSDCRYLSYSIHFSEFMPIIFMRKQTKHENTLSLPFSYGTKMAVDSYWAGKALILRVSFFNGRILFWLVIL